MRKWLVPVLALWALAATTLAVLPRQAAVEPKDEPTERAATEQRPVRSLRQVGRLQRRVDELEAALSASMEGNGEPALEPDDTASSALTPAQQLIDLMDAERTLDESGNWNVTDAQALRRRMYALLAADSSTHVALAERLRDASDEESAWEILSLLVENPFVRSTSSNDDTATIRRIARELLTDENPNRRAAAMRVLLAYATPTKDDVLLGIQRLNVESDATVREEWLAELSIRDRGRGLTEDEARPLVERLRTAADTPQGSWAAGALAEWSDGRSDFDRIADTLSGETDGDRAQELLNAFRRDTRLAGAHEADARDLLLDVLADDGRDPIIRDLAHHFLLDYAPWDAPTTEAVRRYEQERR